jgi:hypothetical protein
LLYCSVCTVGVGGNVASFCLHRLSIDNESKQAEHDNSVSMRIEDGATDGGSVNGVSAMTSIALGYSLFYSPL